MVGLRWAVERPTAFANPNKRKTRTNLKILIITVCLMVSSVLFWYLRISLFKIQKKIRVSKENKQPNYKSLNFSKKYLPKSNSFGTIMMGLLHSTSCGCRFPCSLHKINKNKVKFRTLISYLYDSRN